MTDYSNHTNQLFIWCKAWNLTQLLETGNEIALRITKIIVCFVIIIVGGSDGTIIVLVVVIYVMSILYHLKLTPAVIALYPTTLSTQIIMMHGNRYQVTTVMHIIITILQ